MRNNKLSLISAAILSMLSEASFAADLPHNGQVKAGEATINTAGAEMTIHQKTPKVSIDWDSFDVAKNHAVEFKQPNTDAVAFNRVTGGNASQIQGKLTANGKVFLANPNGVIFSKDAQINVGSLLATTKDLAPDQDIQSKKLKFVRKTNQEGEIKNQAHIAVDSKNGFVVLIGDKVKNEGTIEAKPYEKTETKESRYCSGGENWMCEQDWLARIYGVEWKKTTKTIKTQTPGQVILAAGDSFTLNLEDTYIDVKVDPNTMAGLVRNDGIIIADDGSIELTAAGKKAALDSVVNNNGVLQANHLNVNKSGTITLSAEKVVLDTNSNIQSDNKLNIKSPTSDLNLTANKGAKITVKETEINADKLNFSGQFGREDSNTFFNDEHIQQKNKFTVKTTGKVSINEQATDENAHSHIQNTALASMLESSGQVDLSTNTPQVEGKYRYDLTGFELSGSLTVNPFRNADAVLLMNTPSYVKIQNANIQAKSGRLSIGAALWNFRPETKPAEVDASVTVSNSHFDLNNGSFGVARDIYQRYKVFFSNSGYALEEDQRSFYDFTLTNTQFDRVDDFFVTGGFGKVTLDGFTHTGKMNTYINGGYQRIETEPNYAYLYGSRDLQERLTRSLRDQSRVRWNTQTKVSRGNNQYMDLDELVKREIGDMISIDALSGWNLNANDKFWVRHLDTEINIKNSNINTHNGFIHLMAKQVNLENSNLNVTFDKVVHGTAEAYINKIGINAEQTVLDNSHLRAEGADIKGVSPKEGYATFFLMGNLLGKNKSSIFAKSHQGYTMQTDGEMVLKGENSPDDLKITAINTGEYAQADGSDIGQSNTDDYLSSSAFSPGHKSFRKTVLENATMEVLAPNGSEAYGTRTAAPFEVKGDATFNYFEKPRIRNFDMTKIEGKGGTLLTHKQYLRAFDRAYGIATTNLSTQQTQQIADHNAVLKGPTDENIKAEKVVAFSVCDAKDECEEKTLGNKHSKAEVSVGKIR